MTEEITAEQRRWFLYYAIPAAALISVLLAHELGLVRTPVPPAAGVAALGAVLLLVLPLWKYADPFTGPE